MCSSDLIRHRSRRNRRRSRPPPRRHRLISAVLARPSGPRGGPAPDPAGTAPDPPGARATEQTPGEPTISLDFRQQTSLDWPLSSWAAGHRRRGQRVMWLVGPDSRRVCQCDIPSRWRSRSATRARQGVREVLTVTLASCQEERPNRSSGPGSVRGASLRRGGGSGVRASEEYVWQAVRLRVF